MNERDIERRLREAAEAETPDVLESILSQLGKEQTMENKENITNFPEKKKNRHWQRLGGLAAALALAVGCGAAYLNYSVDAVVGIDVNPSLELKVNRSEKVLEAVALNDDARIVLEGMDLKRVDLDIAVNAIIGSMLKNGYLSDANGAINIAVENSNLARGEALRVKLSQDIDALLVNNAVTAQVVSQTVAEDKALEQVAHNNGVSVGKAALAQKAAEKGDISIEQAANLSVKELWETAFDFIGRDAALAAAYADAGVTGSDVRGIECELDEDDGKWKYEIEFHFGGKEYEYDIDAVNASILKRVAKQDRYDDIEWIDDRPAVQQPVEQPVQPTSSERIGKEAALAAAYADAGVSADAVSRVECELDEDDGKWKYEIEFRANGVEYEYEIDAYTSAVLKREADRDD